MKFTFDVVAAGSSQSAPYSSDGRLTLWGGYRWGLTLTVVVALVSVLASGQLPLWTWLAAPAAVFLVLGSHRFQVAGAVLAVLGIAAGATFIAVFGLGGLVGGGALSLVALLLARLLSGTSLEHDLQAITLAILLILASTALYAGFAFGGLLLVFSVAIVWTLLTRQILVAARSQGQLPAALRHRYIATGRMAVAAVCLVVLVSTAGLGLFVLFPRVGLGRFSMAHQSALAFPHEVGLGGVVGAGGAQVVARVIGVTRQEWSAGLYLRGPVYDRYADGRFKLAVTGTMDRPGRMPWHPPTVETQSYRVYVHPWMEDILPVLGAVSFAAVEGGAVAQPTVAGADGYGVPRASRPLRAPLRYAVRGKVAHQGDVVVEHSVVVAYAARAGEEFSQGSLPIAAVEIGRRLVSQNRGLAGQGMGMSPPLAKIQVVSSFHRYLAEQYRYTLRPGDEAVADEERLDHFLRWGKRGHCEYFASAMAAMLRAVGIRARVVGGVHGGQLIDDAVVFRSSDAHTWVEWYDPARGWVLEDPSPGGASSAEAGFWQRWQERSQRLWDDYVVDYNLEDQVALLQGVRQVGGGLTMRLKSLASRPRVLALGFTATLTVLLILAVVAIRQSERLQRWCMRLLPASRFAHWLSGQVVAEVARWRGRPVEPWESLATTVQPAQGSSTDIHRLVLLYYAWRFGDGPAAAVESALAECREGESAGTFP